MQKSSPSCGGDRTGRELVAASVAVVAGVAMGNFSPPSLVLGVAAVVLACAAALAGLRRRPQGTPWWLAVGLLAGLAACSFAVHRLPGEPTRVAVRFRARVRDGWREGTQGVRNRFLMSGVEAHGYPLRCRSELTAWVGGSVGQAALARAGRPVEGVGELVYTSPWPLAPPTLRIKNAFLVKAADGGGGIDGVRQRALDGLLRAAGVAPARLRAAGLAAALCLGRTDHLSQGEVIGLRRSGLAHLLAVSGLHVGLVAAIAWGVLLLAGFSPRTRRWLLVPLIAGFALLAGGSAPVLRAAAGTIAYLLARQLGRPLKPLPTVWAVVAGLLLVEPAAILQASFQLSAGITLALVRWTSPVAAFLARWPRRLAQHVAAVAVAQGAAVPLVGAIFGAVPPLGVLANLFVAPVAVLLVGLSMSSVAVSWFIPTAAGPLLGGLAGLQGVLDGLARGAGGVSWNFAALPILLTAAMLLLGGIALCPIRAAGWSAAAVVALCALWLGLPLLGTSAGHEAVMLPVREGMAIMVRSGGSVVLIDGGRSDQEAARALAGQRVRRLEAVIVTHADEDHVGGLPAVLERFPVRMLLFNRPEGDRPSLVSLRRLARRRGTAERIVSRGDTVVLGAVTGRVLWPPLREESSGNDSSLVADLGVGPRRFMITGDLESEGERDLVEAGTLPRADILQLPHHGSRTSSSSLFLAAVRPSIVLVPTGTRPRSAYPHREVVSRVHRVHAALVAQIAGLSELRWNEGDLVRIGAGCDVQVRVRPGADQ
jgi:competence protein ComEC